MNGDHEPRYYLEECRPTNGKNQRRRSQHAYASIEAARQALVAGNVTWGPWSDQAFRRKVTEVPRGPPVKGTENWER